MKLPRLLIPKKKRLRASTARRSMGRAEEMDYEEMSEPNMKLSRALLIVLVLHVVAVAGIIAFNALKSRQGAFPPTPAAKTEPTQSATPDAAALASPQNSTAKTSPSATPEAAPLKALPVAPEGNNVYVVAKGDNPVKIAKKLKVSESELLALNKIDDPRKLQIGQKLLIPPKKTASSKAKKSSE
ncbi:MAG: LysM peptidoglycan-binding domain-containing protein [Chthoniobacterales bacterium]